MIASGQASGACTTSNMHVYMRTRTCTCTPAHTFCSFHLLTPGSLGNGNQASDDRPATFSNGYRGQAQLVNHSLQVSISGFGARFLPCVPGPSSHDYHSSRLAVNPHPQARLTPPLNAEIYGARTVHPHQHEGWTARMTKSLVRGGTTRDHKDPNHLAVPIRYQSWQD